jgi:hypothetical protein
VRRDSPKNSYFLAAIKLPRELIRSELSDGANTCSRCPDRRARQTDQTSVYVRLVWLNLTTISLSLTSTLGISS